MFDTGHITFDEDGRIILSELLEYHEAQSFGINERAKLRIVEDSREEYLKYHRANIFRE